LYFPFSKPPISFFIGGYRQFWTMGPSHDPPVPLLKHAGYTIVNIQFGVECKLLYQIEYTAGIKRPSHFLRKIALFP
jgi:hypothetical protein